MILLCWYKRYSIYLISFYSFHGLLPVFICASNTGNQINTWFAAKILIPFIYFAFSWSLSSGGMSGVSTYFSHFSLNHSVQSYLSSIKLLGLYVESINVFLPPNQNVSIHPKYLLPTRTKSILTFLSTFHYFANYLIQ